MSIETPGTAPHPPAPSPTRGEGERGQGRAAPLPHQGGGAGGEGVDPITAEIVRNALVAISDAMKAKLAHYGKAGIRPGDVLLTNDSYIMGSHLNHMIFSLPLFWEGELVGWSASMA